MSDSYTRISHRGLGQNLLDSIKGVLVGILLFVVSFPVLWWNEGRVDLSSIAKRATVVAADGSAAAGEGQLVAVTGPLGGEGPLGDPDYLKPGNFVALRRAVEMYAWVETKTSKEEKKLGGGTETRTTYTYERQWTDSPRRTSEFEVPEGHDNPPLAVEKQSFFAPSARIGVFDFVPADINLPAFAPLPLSPERAVLGRTVSGRYIYIGSGTLEQPRLGDVRISYSALEPGPLMTLYGQRQGTTIGVYVDKKSQERLYQLLPGTHAEAIAAMHRSYTSGLWLLRVVGFFLMWLGLTLVLGPINAVLDIVPFIGSAGRFLTGLALLPIAFVLSAVVIFVAIVAHNPILLALVVLGFIVGGIVYVKRRAARSQPA
jgi:hypothetical protein